MRNSSFLCPKNEKKWGNNMSYQKMSSIDFYKTVLDIMENHNILRNSFAFRFSTMRSRNLLIDFGRILLADGEDETKVFSLIKELDEMVVLPFNDGNIILH